MPRAIDPSKRYHGKPCINCGRIERYRNGGKCCYCDLKQYRAPRSARKPALDPRHRLVPKLAPEPTPHPQIVESDWIKPPTRAQLMGRR